MFALYVSNLFLSVSSTRQDTISHGSPLVTMMALQTGDNDKRMFVGELPRRAAQLRSINLIDDKAILWKVFPLQGSRVSSQKPEHLNIS